MNKTTAFLYQFILLTCFLGYSQKQPYLFKNFTAEDGLSQHDINCITQDDEGFLWFGTNDGLNKFDGYNFEVFKPISGDDTTISGRIVQDIKKDSFGNLWIATLDGGLSLYDSKKERFKSFNSVTSKMGSYANRIIISEDGVLWVQFKSKICYAVIKENIDEMAFSLLSNIDKLKTENNAKRIYTKDKAVYFETSEGTYALKYLKTETDLQNISFEPHSDTYFVKQIKVKNNSKNLMLQSPPYLYEACLDNK